MPNRNVEQCSRAGCNKDAARGTDERFVASIDGLERPLCQKHFEEFLRWENGFFGGMAAGDLERWLELLRRRHATRAEAVAAILSEHLASPRFELEEQGGKTMGIVVSNSFTGMGGCERQDVMRRAIRRSGMSRRSVGMLLAYTEEEWAIPLDGDPPRADD